MKQYRGNCIVPDIAMTPGSRLRSFGGPGSIFKISIFVIFGVRGRAQNRGPKFGGFLLEIFAHGLDFDPHFYRLVQLFELYQMSCLAFQFLINLFFEPKTSLHVLCRPPHSKCAPVALQNINDLWIFPKKYQS